MTMTSTATIYALHRTGTDPLEEPGTVQYVGHTTGYYRHRLAYALYAARNAEHPAHGSARSKWIRSVGEEHVEITPLPQFTSEHEAIEHYGLDSLTNVRAGDSAPRRSTGRGKHDWSEATLSQLGEVDDYSLAEKTGIPRAAITKKRLALGIEAHGQSRALSDDDVYDASLIYEHDTDSQLDLAELFGVAVSTMSKALRREGAYSQVPEATFPMPA